MSKWEFWKKKRKDEDLEVLPWGQGYERYVDTTKSSIFASGEEDWDLTSQKPVFSPHPENGRGRTYEDFLRARGSSTRSFDGPYGSSGGYRRFYEEEDERGGQPLRRIMQLVGSVALVVLLYFTFHSNQPTALRVQAFVKNSITQDSNVKALSGWWQQNISNKVALPTFSQLDSSVQTATPTKTSATAQDSTTQKSAFVLPVQGTVKTPYDGTTQQGVTFEAAAGSEVKSAGDGMVEKVDKAGTQDFTVTINNGSAGKTIYRHIASVSVAANDWVKADDTIGVLSNKGTNAQLFFAYEKDGSFVNPDEILNLPTGR